MRFWKRGMGIEGITKWARKNQVMYQGMVSGLHYFTDCKPGASCFGSFAIKGKEPTRTELDERLQRHRNLFKEPRAKFLP